MWQSPTPPSVTDSRAGEAEGDTTEEPPVSDKKALAIAAAWGGCYTYALAERLKNARPLHWVQAHPDDVATQNFLAGAGADSFRNLGDYDVVELRAIYAACPELCGNQPVRRVRVIAVLAPSSGEERHRHAIEATPNAP